MVIRIILWVALAIIVTIMLPFIIIGALYDGALRELRSLKHRSGDVFYTERGDDDVEPDL